MKIYYGNTYAQHRNNQLFSQHEKEHNEKDEVYPHAKNHNRR